MAHLPQGLTVGLIVGSKTIWRWQIQMIQSLIEWHVISVQNIIVLDQPSFKNDVVISLLHKLDSAVFRSPVDAFDLLSADLLGVNTLSVDEYVSAGGFPDALIDFSEVETLDSLTATSRYGVLQPIFDEFGSLQSENLGIKPLIEQKTQVCLSISLRSDARGPQILGQIKPSFNQGDFSRNLTDYWVWFEQLWKRELLTLASQQGDQNKAGHSSLSSGQVAKNTSGPGLSLSEAMRAFSRVGGNIKRKLQQKYRQTEQWTLLLKSLSDNESIGDKANFQQYQELTPPSDCFWADPFIVSEAGSHYLFFEELPFATERGHLCCLELFADGRYSEPVKIIEESHHLSYPNVFKYEGEYYLIPESGEAGRIDLYHSTNFPYEWSFRKTLISGVHAYDATLLEHQGEWWMFATVTPKQGLSGCEELHIYRAGSPVSEHWQAHENNPVISDASRARPGGNFFIADGRLHRVSQDCAGQYGAGINVNRVDALSIDEYQETLVSTHYPDWDEKLIALHTFNLNEYFAVADVLKVKPKGTFQ